MPGLRAQTWLQGERRLTVIGSSIEKECQSCKELTSIVADLEQQLAEHEKSAAAALLIVLEGKSSEKYPALAAVLDAYVAERVRAKIDEIEEHVRLFEPINDDESHYQRHVLSIIHALGCTPSEKAASGDGQ